ncbi:MAG: hypothetical protein Q8P01_01790 [bacterium]|nr:hypothetical protein [bacterium]
MKNSIFPAVLILAFGLIFIQPVLALTISPVRMEIAGDPGQTLRGEIELFNEQGETKTFYSSAANFEARGDSGAPYFLPDTTKGLASWITIQDNVVLKADERKIIPYTIQIPQGVEAGGYFAAIFWGTSPPGRQGGEQVSVSGKLGMLILLSVKGELKEGGGLLDLKIDEGGRVASSFPITFAYRFSNDGSERVKPTGELKIKNLFGFTTATLDANSGNGNVLPGSIRKFKIVWFEKGQDKLAVFSPPAEGAEENHGFFSSVSNQWRNFAFGLYSAKLNLTYGNDNKTAETSYRFFVIPWQLLSILVFILAIFGIGGWFGIKRYNRWVIKKAQAGKFQ